MGGLCGHCTKPLGCITVGLFLICCADLESQEGLLCDVSAGVSDTKVGLEIYYQLEIFIYPDIKFELVQCKYSAFGKSLCT